MRTKKRVAFLLILGWCLLASCGPSPTAFPTGVPVTSLPPPATTVALPPTVPHYPPPPTAPPPTSTPTPTPPPTPFPALPLLEVAPAADFDLEEVIMLGISQTEGVALQVRLRSGEMRTAPLDLQVVPTGALYRTQWEDPYIFLLPTCQSATISSAPLVAIDLASKTLYRLEVPRGYWVGPLILSPDHRQVAFFQVWQWGWCDSGYEPSGPGWEVRVWDMTARQGRVLFYADRAHKPHYPVYWSQVTGQLYLQRVILESDAGLQELAAVAPDGSAWQVYEQVRRELAFSPDGQSVAYLAYDAQLETGYIYYRDHLVRPFNQVWVLDLQTGHSRLLVQEEDGAQYYEPVFEWTAEGLLLERLRGKSPSIISEWQVILVNTVTGETSLIFTQLGEWPTPFHGPLFPQKDHLFLWNWSNMQYAVLDLASGQLQDVTSLVSGMGQFLWCESGTVLIEQWGGQVFRMDLETMSAEPLEAWTEVAFCR